MASTIHPTAVIEPGAVIADGVSIGPLCVIDQHVKLGAGVKLESHVVVAGHTTIGANTHVFPFASLGHQPQDLKFKGEPSQLMIGAGNTIREYVTMNPGTEGGGMLTQVGDHCLFMAGAHVAHDCKVGNHVILANNATLAGHVTVGDYAIIGGLSAVHQFVRVGPHAMIGGMSGIEADLIPYASALGERANLAGLNLVGLKRRGFSREVIHEMRKAFKAIFVDDGDTLAERLEKVEIEYKNNPQILEIVEFIRADSSRSLCQPRDSRHHADA